MLHYKNAMFQDLIDRMVKQGWQPTEDEDGQYGKIYYRNARETFKPIQYLDHSYRLLNVWLESNGLIYVKFSLI